MNDDFARIRLLVNDLIARIRPTIPKGRTDIRPEWGRRKYRGKDQIVVGYSWAKPYSGPAGRVYEVVLGWGRTFDDAYALAEKRASDREDAAP
jgi:hypothetical protein